MRSRAAPLGAVEGGSRALARARSRSRTRWARPSGWMARSALRCSAHRRRRSRRRRRAHLPGRRVAVLGGARRVVDTCSSAEFVVAAEFAAAPRGGVPTPSSTPTSGCWSGAAGPTAVHQQHGVGESSAFFVSANCSIKTLADYASITRALRVLRMEEATRRRTTPAARLGGSPPRRRPADALHRAEQLLRGAARDLPPLRPRGRRTGVERRCRGGRFAYKDLTRRSSGSSTSARSARRRLSPRRDVELLQRLRLIDYCSSSASTSRRQGLGSSSSPAASASAAAGGCRAARRADERDGGRRGLADHLPRHRRHSDRMVLRRLEHVNGVPAAAATSRQPPRRYGERFVVRRRLFGRSRRRTRRSTSCGGWRWRPPRRRAPLRRRRGRCCSVAAVRVVDGIAAVGRGAERGGRRRRSGAECTRTAVGTRQGSEPLPDRGSVLRNTDFDR